MSISEGSAPAVAASGATAARPLRRIAGRLASLAGWRRLAMAALLGGLGALAMPPAYAVPALFVAFPGLLWLAEGARGRRAAFAIGWFFGFGHFVLGLYWVSFALLTDVARYWWMMPFAVAGLPALLAFFPGLALLCLHALGWRGLARVLAFGALWAAFEWLRGHLFTGFPWNLAGYAWVGFEPVLQTTALVGIYGLSLVTVTVASLPALLPDTALPRGRAWLSLAMGLAVIAVLGAGGAWRLASAEGAMVEDVRLRLVQPAIDQRLKWAPGEREANFLRHLELSAAPAEQPPTHVIWPETAVPFLLERDMARRLAVASVTPRGGLTIAGAPRLTEEPDGGRRFWNGLVALDGSGIVQGTYDKAHLVPFGEYMPLRSWIPVAAVASAGMDFSAGTGPRTLDLPGLPPVSPLICYEVIFPGAVTDPGRRPSWLLNLTNDAWYGLTAGPHQHFAIARVRAVEEGLPLVRVANNGISGVVDPWGRVVAHLGLGKSGVLDAPLPAAGPATPYALWGDTTFGVILLLVTLGATIARHSR